MKINKIKTKKSLILFLLIVIILFIAGLWYLSKKLNQNKSQVVVNSPIFLDISYQNKYWTQKVDSMGVQKAYEEFKKENLNRELKLRHTAAHLFGNILFKKMGLKAMTVCDDEFWYGCYHSIITRSLEKDGLKIMPELEKICLAKKDTELFACLHGIGHGLMETYGYSFSDLLKSINTCDLISMNKKVGGCTWGALMAYKMPIVNSKNNYEENMDWKKKLDNDNPYDPCPKIPPESQSTCYAQLSIWWYKVNEIDFKTMGPLCAKIKDDILRERCFFGIGETVANITKYDLKKTVENCSLMSIDAGVSFCLIGAADGYRSYPPKKSLAADVCRSLRKDGQKKCLQMVQR